MDSEELRLQMLRDGLHRLKVRLFKLDKRLWATLKAAAIPSSMTATQHRDTHVSPKPTLSKLDGEWE